MLTVLTVDCIYQLRNNGDNIIIGGEDGGEMNGDDGGAAGVGLGGSRHDFF